MIPLENSMFLMKTIGVVLFSKEILEISTNFAFLNK